MAKETLYKIGYVIKPHGFLGDLKVKLEVGFQFSSNLEVLFIGNSNKPLPYFVSKFKYVKPTEVILSFDELENKEDAELLKGKQLFSIRPWKGNKNNKDLKNYHILDSTSRQRYKINEVLELPGQILLELVIANNKTLIPFHKDLIISTDEKSKTIELEIPDGLIN